MSLAENACSYAAMILQDEGIPVTAEKIAHLVKAANVQIETYWPSLFAKLAEKCDLNNLMMNVGSGGGGGGAAPMAAVAAPAGGGTGSGTPAPEEEKEEPEEESEDDMGFSLFD